MTNPHSFQQVLRTSTLLVFALSFNAFNVTASENGSYAGPDFLNSSDFAGPARVVVAPAAGKDFSKVLGYAVQTAATFGTTPTSARVETIMNPIDSNDDPTPMPIVTTSTPTSTTPITFSNVASHNNNDRTATITWDSNVSVEIYGVNWYEVGSDEEYWHYAGSQHVQAASSHSITLGDRENWLLNEGSTYKYQVCNALDGTAQPTCSADYSFVYNSTDPSSPYDLGVVSVEALTTGLKFQFCNHGAAIQSFPVIITVNSTQRSFDLSSPTTYNTCVFQTWTYDMWGITPTSGAQYAVEVIVNRHSALIEKNLWNNTLQQWVTVPTLPSACVGPYHVLASDGRCVWSCSQGTTPGTVEPFECVCQPGLVETGTDQFGRRICTEAPTVTKVTICHKTGANSMVEIVTDKDGWTNGHAKHEGDYPKNGSLPCRVPKVPTEPVAVTPPTTTLSESDKDAIIRKLQDRISKLEYKLSQIEQEVVEREKNRESRADASLTNRVAGKLLIQPQSVGEVWYVDPVTKQKYYLKDGTSAYQALKAFGLGISEEDFTKLGDGAFARSLRGKILLRVHSHGEAYYIDDAGVAHYLKDGAAAYELMRTKALGISNDDISKIQTGSLAQ